MKTKFVSRSKRRKAEREKAIIAMYEKHIADAQSKMALYEAIAEKYDLSIYTVAHLITRHYKDGQTDRN